MTKLQSHLSKNKDMLFADWEVRIVKYCDLGLENAALSLRTQAAFYFFPAINWLTSLFAYATLLLHIWLNSELLMLVASSSPVTFSKILSRCEISSRV